MRQERFSRRRLKRKPLVSDPGMHHGACVRHVPWCMSGLLTHSGGENVPGVPGACATRNFTYLVRGPWHWWIRKSYCFLAYSVSFFMSSAHLIIIPNWAFTTSSSWFDKQNKSPWVLRHSKPRGIEKCCGPFYFIAGRVMHICIIYHEPVGWGGTILGE